MNNNGLESPRKISQTPSTLEPAPQVPAYEEEPDGAALATIPASQHL